ncbi:MAG: C10 family peptidase, partial [Treponema sp.]|nr:C10 family peptidase [Treponema sp.]
MKNNNLRSIIFGLTVITVCILTAACKDFFQPPEARGKPQTQALSALDRKDELALMHANGNFETAPEELQSQIQAMLQLNVDAAVQRGETLASASSITGMRSFFISVENGFSLGEANKQPQETAQEAGEIPFYVFDLTNGAEHGFALACGDARIGTVIAVVEDGDFDDRDNPFMKLFHSFLEGYVYRAIDEYNQITDEDVKTAIAKSRPGDARVIIPGWDTPVACVEPLTKGTQWNQNGYPHSPYNRIINTIAGNANEDLWPAGCVAVAVAQIMAYHKWPEVPHYPIRKPSANPTSSTPKIYNFQNPYPPYNTVLFSDIAYDWNGMKHSSDINGNLLLDPYGNLIPEPKANNLHDIYKMQVGVLMAAIGDKVSMKYGSGGSESSINKVQVALPSMGYSIPAIGNYYFSNIKTSLDQGKPVYIRGEDGKDGHAWVIDGYRTINSSGATVNYVRCNVGWGGTNNGWYVSFVFDMRGDAVVVEKSVTPDYFQNNIKILTNIKPNAPVVNIAAIPGLTPPASGATPVTAITETSQYTGTVSWSPAIPPGGTFGYGTTYTATVALKHKQGFTLIGVPANFFKVEGATPVSNAANSGIVSAVFPVTETSVNITAIQGITPPVAGAVPSSTITETSQYTGTMYWSPQHALFQDNKQYAAVITLTPKPGYTLEGVPPNSFTVAGATMYCASDYSVIIAQFPATA